MRHARLLIATSALVAGWFLPAAAPALADEPADVPSMQAVLAEFQQGNWALAADAARTLAERAGEGRAWIVAGAAYQQAGRPDEALSAYQAYLEVCADPAVRAYVLGQMALCRSDEPPDPPPAPPCAELDDAARRQLADAAVATGVQLSEHFEVRSPNPLLNTLLADLGEQALARVHGLIEPNTPYPHRVQVVVHRTPAEYQARFGAAGHWSSGRFELTVDDAGNVRRVIHLVQLDQAGLFNPDILDRVLPHELCHLVLTEWFGPQDCPLYLQEGLAIQAEFAEQEDRIILAGTALATGQCIGIEPLTESLDYDEQTLPLFYTQSYSLVDYLRDRLSGQQFRQVLLHVRDGQTLEEALHRALAMPPEPGFLDQLAQAWRDHAVGHAQFLLTLRGLAPAAPPDQTSAEDEAPAEAGQE